MMMMMSFLSITTGNKEHISKSGAFDFTLSIISPPNLMKTF
jgi:hypothetical protein